MAKWTVRVLLMVGVLQVLDARASDVAEGGLPLGPFGK